MHHYFLFVVNSCNKLASHLGINKISLLYWFSLIWYEIDSLDELDSVIFLPRPRADHFSMVQCLFYIKINGLLFCF